MLERTFKIGYLASDAAEALERGLRKALNRAFPYEPVYIRISRGLGSATVRVEAEAPRTPDTVKAFYLAVIRGVEDAREELQALRATEAKFAPRAERALQEFASRA